MYLKNKIIHIGLLFMILLSFRNQTMAQSSIRDSSINMLLIGGNYSISIAGGDLAKEFGWINTVGISFSYKLKCNILFGLSYSYLFGSDVKETNMLDKIISSSGFLINNQGEMSPVDFGSRGYEVMAKVGKLFPGLGPNDNSGILATINGGFLQHRINFTYIGPPVPQITGDYTKGYDRLSNGFSLSEDVGYLHLSNNNYLNFNVGFEFTQAFTKNRRWNYDTMNTDDNLNIDLMFGAYIQINIPLYTKAPNSFYFN